MIKFHVPVISGQQTCPQFWVIKFFTAQRLN